MDGKDNALEELLRLAQETKGRARLFCQGLFQKLLQKILKHKKIRLLKDKAAEYCAKGKRKWIALKFYRRQNKDKKLTRYIVKQLLLYFFVMYLFFFLIFFVNQIMLFMKQLLGKRIPIVDAMKLMFYSLPFVIAQSAPFATLTGFLMCLGRMNTDNEILIFKASGCNLRKLLLKPIAVLGVIISIFSFFVNDYLLPLGTSKTREQLRKSIASNPTMEVEAQSVKRLNDTSVVFGNVSDKDVSDLLLLDYDESGNQRFIVAGKTHVDSGAYKGVSMRFDMNDATVIVLDRSKPSDFDLLKSKTMSLHLFESTVFNFERSLSPAELTSFDLGKRIGKMKKEGGHDPREINMNVLEYNKKFSLPFGSLFFAFLAMPLALLFGKVNGQTIGLVVGIFISFLYWAMMTVGIQLGYRNGLNGFFLMWLPNTVVGLSAFLFYLGARKK
ncbi:MAG: LptF/LptG family permease [Treponema sp.]|nr:LptF/LptG family permease [Treponema sp.]MEE3436236.1 LptF/LptG family permease [Treponema sp.]